LVVKKENILAVPSTDLTILPTAYKDGAIHPPNSFFAGMVKNPGNTRPLSVGEKVYVYNLDVNLKNEKIQFFLIDCDSCNGTTGTVPFKAVLIFEFAKGYLEAADPGQVQDTISQVFDVDNGQSDTQQAPAPGDSAGTPGDASRPGPPAGTPGDHPTSQQSAPVTGEGGATQQTTLCRLYLVQKTGAQIQLNPDGSFSMHAANGQVSPGNFTVNGDTLILTYTATGRSSTPFKIQGDKVYASTGAVWVPQGECTPLSAGSPGAAAAPPIKLSVGMTIDQVKAAMGDPVSIAEVGTKVIYVYKDFKITFVNGKVSNIE
jgi:hypothetical protein